ncbi:hypothetical protein [Pedobacter sp. MW01-1-1]|uniref:hypothetical protein n=1 Tax=Pedobacter sp. MW01-1-1 TaxID=3383027 RepID=UPI003FED959B
MKKIVFSLFTCWIVLQACSDTKKEGKDAIQFKNVNQTVVKSFSNLSKQDTFKLEFIGEKPEEIAINFSIKTADNKQIYAVQLKGKDLLGSTDPNVDLRKEKDQIVFLKSIADDFFSEDNFLEPAVLPEDKSDDYTPDKAFFEALKKTKLNGFKYRLGKENNIYIAWDDATQKVKIYYNCC